MQKEELIKKVLNLDDLTTRYKDSITEKSLSKVYRNSGMSSADKMAEDIAAVQTSGRLLNIGVIGRVKAGKSSLLNSLFFDGESVLPKAATPMTAALTTMTYGRNFKATVQLYDEKDIESIHEKANEYSRLEKKIRLNIQQKENTRFSRLRAKVGQSKEGGNLDERDIEQKRIEEKITRRVRLELSEYPELEAAFSQSEELKKKKRPVDRGNSLETSATDLTQLKKELENYVAAQGEFTPYTKSVDLYLPYEKLKDIKVIDTPGVNDPIVSREQRTNALLMQCDVVLIVSPGGKFFDAKDQQLVTRLTKREGVQHIYFVASQIDSTLHAPEFVGQPLSQSLPALSNDLCRHLDNEIQKMVANDENGTVQALRGDQDSLLSRFTLVSAMADAISQKQMQGHKLQEDEEHALDNIKECFELDYESNQQYCLETLSGIKRVNELIEKSRDAKAQIIAERQQSVIEQYSKVTDEYHRDLISLITKRQSEIDDADIKVLEASRNGMQKIRTKVQDELDGEYKLIIKRLERELVNVNSEITKFTGSKHDEANSELSSKTINVKTGIWLWKKTYEDSYDVVNSTTLSSSLALASKQYGSVVRSFFNSELAGKSGFESKMVQELFKVFQGLYNSEDLIGIDSSSVKSAIREVVSNVPIESFDEIIALPDNLGPAGQLTRSEASRFMSDSKDFIGSLDCQYRNLSKQYISKLLNVLPNSMTDSIFEELDDEIKKTGEDIEYAKLRKFSLEQCMASLEAL